MENIYERSRPERIGHSNCWEDADVLLRALDVKEGGVYLSIASAGDNTLALLSKNPGRVIAVDRNPAQLACLDLRRAAFLVLSYEEILRFIGVKECDYRLKTYNSIKNHLCDESRFFWDAHSPLIKKGIIHAGRLENYFRIFRKYLLPVIHGKKKIAGLLKPKTNLDRWIYYDEIWNTALWRILFKTFSSRHIKNLLRRDSKCSEKSGGEFMDSVLRRIEYGLTEIPTHSNPYLEYFLTGKYRNPLPFYLRKENFDSIRNNLGRLVLIKDNIEGALRRNRYLLFDGFNLSNIFEGMRREEYARTMEKLALAGKEGARLVYWNLCPIVNGPEEVNDKLRPLPDLAAMLFSRDKVFFHNSLIIKEVIEAQVEQTSSGLPLSANLLKFLEISSKSGSYKKDTVFFGDSSPLFRTE